MACLCRHLVDPVTELASCDGPGILGLGHRTSIKTENLYLTLAANICLSGGRSVGECVGLEGQTKTRNEFSGPESCAIKSPAQTKGSCSRSKDSLSCVTANIESQGIRRLSVSLIDNVNRAAKHPLSTPMPSNPIIVIAGH